ncbi:molybdate ABC transporter substrate-binding protein [Spongiimicrobium sp. 3-5]|uniref:molybdate ABC transporter substrate-binding protein n=1 Tax=Spongiimicrobium sp. 3-5 TaxID=3332596 RepID=UPI00397F0171
MKRILLFRSIPLILVLLSVACADRKGNNTVMVATSANMQFTMTKIVDKFYEKTGIDVTLIVSSSGKLTAQIKEGAPYDVLVAADMKYPVEIFNSDLAETSPKTYAYGKLVLWSMKDSINPSIAMLSDDTVSHIALANPKTAPYGIASAEVLNHYQIYDELEGKLVFGESIAQTNQFITSGAAEVGFTAMSVVLSQEMKDKGKWVALDASSYTPIEQGIVLIKRGKDKNKAARRFYEFIFSEEAKKILMNFGYSVDE